MRNIAIFASGKGTNFIAIHEAILQQKLDANISLFITDKPNSEGFKKASCLNLNAFAFIPKDFDSKESYEKEILLKLKEYDVELIVLAGYMRIVGHTILKQYEKRIINIHPSLLPLFKGKDAIGQALLAGTSKTGVTVHFVDEGIDTGEIIMQEEVKILDHFNRELLEEVVHKTEHELYYKAIRKVLEGKL